MCAHALTCMAGGSVTLRHHALRDVVWEKCKAAGLHPELEKAGLLPGTLYRPADVWLPRWPGGGPCNKHVDEQLKPKTGLKGRTREAPKDASGSNAVMASTELTKPPVGGSRAKLFPLGDARRSHKAVIDVTIQAKINTPTPAKNVK